jgi:hypothetical protein
VAVTFVALWGNGIRITDPAQVNASVAVDRPWGKEIRVDLTDGTQLYHEVLNYPSMPTKTRVRDDVIALIAKITAMLNPPTKTITCMDGFALVVLESDCPVNVDLRVTLTAEQQAAWAIVKPLLGAWLLKIMRVYRILPPEKQGELRNHNTLLNQVLEMVGE